MMEDKTARFWIRIFGYILLISSLQFIIMGVVMVSTEIKYALRCMGVKGIVTLWVPLGIAVISLLMLCGSVGLLILKKWGKILIILTLPLFFIFYSLILVSGEGVGIFEFLYRTSLIPVVYLVLIYFFNRPKVKEQFR